MTVLVVTRSLGTKYDGTVKNVKLLKFALLGPETTVAQVLYQEDVQLCSGDGVTRGRVYHQKGYPTIFLTTRRSRSDGKGLFTYDVSQKWGDPDPPFLLFSQNHKLAYHLPQGVVSIV